MNRSLNRRMMQKVTAAMTAGGLFAVMTVFPVMAQYMLTAIAESSSYHVTYDANGGVFRELSDEGDVIQEIGETYSIDVSDSVENFTLMSQGISRTSKSNHVVHYSSTIHAGTSDYRVVKDGYVLSGWTIPETGETFPDTSGSLDTWEENEFTSYISYDVKYTLTKDITLKAVWEKQTTITFDYDGGTHVDNETEASAKTYTCAESWAIRVDSVNLPQKEGLVFNGWMETETGEYYEMTPDGYNSAWITTDQDKTFKAVWVNQIEITYDPGDRKFNYSGGDMDENGLIHRYNGVGMKEPFGFGGGSTGYYTQSEDGDYVVVGWTLAGDTSGKVYDDVGSITLPDGDVTYKAVWRKKLNVTYDPNGGHFYSGEDTAKVQYAAKDTPYAVWLYGGGGSGYGWGRERDPLREGYVFTGWQKENSVGDTLYQNGSICDSLTEDTIFKAHWALEGDVNGDDSFDLLDLVAVQKWLLGNPDVQLANPLAGDLCLVDDVGVRYVDAEETEYVYYDIRTLDIFDLALMKRALLSK